MCMTTLTLVEVSDHAESRHRRFVCMHYFSVAVDQVKASSDLILRIRRHCDRIMHWLKDALQYRKKHK